MYWLRLEGESAVHCWRELCSHQLAFKDIPVHLLKTLSPTFIHFPVCAKAPVQRDLQTDLESQALGSIFPCSCNSGQQGEAQGKHPARWWPRDSHPFGIWGGSPFLSKFFPSDLTLSYISGSYLWVTKKDLMTVLQTCRPGNQDSVLSPVLGEPLQHRHYDLLASSSG